MIRNIIFLMFFSIQNSIKCALVWHMPELYMRCTHRHIQSLCVCAHRSHAAHTEVVHAIYTEHTQIQAWLTCGGQLEFFPLNLAHINSTPHANHDQFNRKYGD